MNWRLRKETAGSGSHGDLNAHLIDTARFLVGDIAETVGLQETFIAERPKEGQAIGLTVTNLSLSMRRARRRQSATMCIM